MKLTFTYERDRDIWCILQYGKTSLNSPLPTKIYEELIKEQGDTPSVKNTSMFIDSYLSTHHINTEQMRDTLQQKWDTISSLYQKKAEEIFGITLTNDVTVYITINDRCPYSIEEDMFFVSLAYPHAANKTAMHELWHFYTWYKYGVEWEAKLGESKYNELKEALTVLLNVECKDLLPEGISDRGYPQHQELRARILELWSKEKNMDTLWQTLVV